MYIGISGILIITEVYTLGFPGPDEKGLPATDWGWSQGLYN